MYIVIVNNPQQVGATDGAFSIFRSLQSMHPELNIDIEIVNNISEVKEPPVVLCSVGPDTTHIATEIYDKFNVPFMMGMKEPYLSDTPVEEYSRWKFICDTMGTMKGTIIYNAKPDLIYIPQWPPFSITKKDLEKAKEDPILQAFKPDILMAIGGADPYTLLDLSNKDVEKLYSLGIKLSEGNKKIAVATSKRTSPEIIDLLKDIIRTEDNWGIYDYHNQTFMTQDQTIHNNTGIYRAGLAVASIIIPSDDSLSMMAEATVTNAKVLIYNTFASLEYYKVKKENRRMEVAENVCKASGAISTFELDKNPNLQLKKVKSLEGVIDREVAEQLYQKMAEVKIF